MMKTYALASLVAFGCLSLAAAAPTTNTIYDFSMKNIDGKEVSLAKYKGKVLLVVNVASQCGFTPQYKALEAVYNAYRKKGVVILGFPANNFGAQEPGTDKEIKEFCTSKFDVTFPMFSKISVKGDDEADLYKWLIANSDRPNDPISWNFNKFIVGKDGKVVARFESKSTPDSPEVTGAIQQALGAK